MNKLATSLLASVALAALATGLSHPATADTAGTGITQSATGADAATFWIGPGGGVACSTGTGTSASDTVTITPPAGNFVYITDIIEQLSTDATGVTQTGTISFTNIASAGNASPYLSYGSALGTVGADTINMVIPFPLGGLRSSQPGVAVTIVPSATQQTHSYLCLSAVGYFNPN